MGMHTNAHHLTLLPRREEDATTTREENVVKAFTADTCTVQGKQLTVTDEKTVGCIGGKTTKNGEEDKQTNVSYKPCVSTLLPVIE